MVSIEALIKDIKHFGPTITRDEYLEKGQYSKHAYLNHFANFGEFRNVAFSNEPFNNVLTGQPETNQFHDDKWEVSLPKTGIHTLPELLEYCKVDLSIWEVERFTVNKWEVGAKDEDSNIQVTPLFQVKATLAKRKAIIAIREEIESLKAEAKKFSFLPKEILRSEKLEGNLLEILIPDLHAGKLAWSKETGYQNYDTKLSEEAYYRALSRLIERVLLSGLKIDHIVLGVGNDLLHTDNLKSQTTRGTQVDSDVRYTKTYATVRKMIVNAIERLRLIAPVTVKLIPGNHDTVSNFTLGDSLECWFHNYTDVVIDNAPIQHKFFVWGDCLVMMTHGDAGKQGDYGLWLATECAKEFGNSKFREVHVGHKHKLMVDEKFGVRVRTLSALCPPDAWHARNGFVGNLRSAEAFVWNKNEGIVAQFFHTETN